MSESKKKALIYARVSSERQKNEGHGLDSQSQRCVDYARSKGYEIEKIFEDSFTGAGDFMERPAMRELLGHIDAHPSTSYVVIFDDLKRFARDLPFHIKLRNEFKYRNAIRECLNFNFEDTPEGEFLENILAAQSELERKQNKRQVIQKMKARLEAGYWSFYPPPGYITRRDPLHGKLLVPHEPMASIIREALEGYASGRFQDQVDVQRFLNEKGFYEGKKNKRVYLEQVKRLLTRILYAGYIEYPEWEVARRKGHHEGLISLETYLAIQDRLSGKVKNFTRKDLNEDFPSRGLVCCATCGHALTASWSSGRNKKFPYYRCNLKDCAEGGRSIRRDDLESSIGKLLIDITPRQEILDYAKARLLDKWNKRVSDFKVVQREREQELIKLREEIRDLTQLASTTKDSRIRTTYEGRLGELMDREMLLEAKAVKPSERAISFETAIDVVFDYLKNPHHRWNTGDLAEKRLILKLVFSDLLKYDRVRGFETAQLALPLKVFEAISAPEAVGCGDAGS